jgi:hypothetical protein
MTPIEAAKAFRVSTRTIQRWIKEGKLMRTVDGEVHVQPSGNTGGFVEGRAYLYDPDSRRYIFSLRSKAGKPFVVPEDVVRQVVAAYSSSGAKATVNEIARTFGWARATVMEVLKALGKTHDSAPKTDEDLASGDEAELAEDLVRMKEERVLREAERKTWEETKRLAAKAKRFDTFVSGSLKAALADGVPAITLPAFRPVRAKERLAVVLSPTDLHYGKASWRDETGEEFDRQSCANRLRTSAERALGRIERLGHVERIVIGAGSDWFHIDSERGGASTTAGTPQHADGSWARIFLEGAELAAQYVARLSQLAPVQVVQMAGNHDKHGSLALTAWLQQRFREVETRVSVTMSPHPRQYVTYEQNLIGITHGDGAPEEKLPMLMATEASQSWATCPQRTWITGHRHTDRRNESFGVQIVGLPSLAGTDAWHAGKGYVGNRKNLKALAFHPQEGLIAEISCLPD